MYSARKVACVVVNGEDVRDLVIGELFCVTRVPDAAEIEAGQNLHIARTSHCSLLFLILILILTLITCILFLFDAHSSPIWPPHTA